MSQFLDERKSHWWENARDRLDDHAGVCNSAAYGRLLYSMQSSARVFKRVQYERSLAKAGLGIADGSRVIEDIRRSNQVSISERIEPWSITTITHCQESMNEASMRIKAAETNSNTRYSYCTNDPSQNGIISYSSPIIFRMRSSDRKGEHE
jgi:hypothetical protein